MNNRYENSSSVQADKQRRKKRQRWAAVGISIMLLLTVLGVVLPVVLINH